MITMNDIMTNFVGDWLYDKKKLENLTEERAFEDIRAMSASPDYSVRDVKVAIRRARRQLGLREEQFLARIILT